MFNIRKNTFETNSSSTHTIAIASASEYNDFREDKRVFNKGYYYSSSEFKNKDLIDKDEFLDIISKSKYDLDHDQIKAIAIIEQSRSLKEAIQKIYDELDDTFESIFEYEFETYENLGGGDFEVFSKSFKTENGDEIVAFGYYGYDG